MASKILSVDIGYSLTKVCEMDYQAKTPKIYHSFTIQTPEHMIADGVVTVNEEFIVAFQAALNQKKIKTKKVIFSIASSRIATREVQIPYCKPNKIVDIVRANLEEYFPIDASKYMISHSILGVEGGEQPSEVAGKGKKQAKATQPTGYKLQLLAAPKPLMESYEALAKAMNLEIVTIDYNGNSIYQAAKENCDEGIQLVIKVDERSSLLLVLKDGVIDLNRTIPYGIDDAMATLMETTQLGIVSDYRRAIHLAKQKACILDTFTPLAKDEVDIEQKEKAQVTASLEAVVSGIARVVDYYNSNHTDEQIEKMYLTGVGAEIVGFDTLLSSEVGAQVDILDSISGIQAEKFFGENGFGQFITCIGATLDPLTFYADKPADGKSKGKSQINGTQLATIICGLGIGVGLILIVTSVVPYVMEQNRKEGYEKTIAELQPVYDTYVTYKQLENELETLKSLDRLTKNRNEELVSLIETLERNMPASFRLNSLSASTENVIMSVTVATKEESAVVLSELRKLSAFTQTDTTSIAEVTTEIGETQYTFTVEMIYAPILETTEEAEES